MNLPLLCLAIGCVLFVIDFARDKSLVSLGLAFCALAGCLARGL